jgi:hypothetical protein
MDRACTENSQSPISNLKSKIFGQEIKPDKFLTADLVHRQNYRI